MGPFDRIAVRPQALEAGVEAGPGALAVACFPMGRTDLAVQARSASPSPAAGARAHHLVMRQRLGPSAGQRQQVGEPFAHRASLVFARDTARQRGERALVVADRVLIRVDDAGTVAGAVR